MHGESTFQEPLGKDGDRGVSHMNVIEVAQRKA